MDAIAEILNAFVEMLKTIGLFNSMAFLFFIAAHYMIFKLYLDRLQDRQEQINLMAEDNRAFRTHLLKHFDATFGDGGKK